MKISKYQQTVIDKIKAGCVLIRAFDVYGGYWYFLRSGGGREIIQQRTVEALERIGVIRAGENKRVHSGYQEMSYELLSNV